MIGIVIVVNYEQEPEIGSFLDQLRASNPGLDVVVVDEGSRDRSPEIAEKRGFRVLRHPSNLGVGAAIRTGIRHAQAAGRYDYVVIMSSNGKMHADELPRVIGPIVDGTADYVQGSRFLHGGRSLNLSGFRHRAIPAFSTLASALLGRRFSDITCGFRAYRLALFDDQRLDLDQPWLDRYELEYYIHYWAVHTGARMVEVPVTIDYSHLGQARKSKIVPIVGWWRMLRPFVFLTTGLKR
jgi:dolichol-phosphate mannosyltransferase